MRILITGISGFVGSHLAELALARGAQVHGSIRRQSRLENLAPLQARLQLTECDLTDPEAVRRLVEEVRPERVFHLAAQSFVPTSWEAPAETFQANVIAQIHLFEALKGSGARVLVASSSEVYGLVRPEEVPVREDNPLRPLSPYAVSKLAQDMLGFQYSQGPGLHVVRARAFNHTGPRRGASFVESSFARQVARIERGLQEPVVRVGNLEARRDFTDVRDVVRAYWLLLERGLPGEAYNVCRGASWSIQEVLDHLLSRSAARVAVEVDPGRLRPSDVRVLEGSCEKLQAATGWRPEIPLAQTLDDLLEDWRGRVGAVPR